MAWYHNIERIKKKEDAEYGFAYANNPTLIEVMKKIIASEKKGEPPDEKELEKLETIKDTGITDAKEAYETYRQAKDYKPIPPAATATSDLNQDSFSLGKILSTTFPQKQISRIFGTAISTERNPNEIAAIYCKILALSFISLAVAGFFWPGSADALGIGNGKLVAFNFASGFVTFVALWTGNLRTRTWAVSRKRQFRLAVLIVAVGLFVFFVLAGFYIHAIIYFVILLMIMVVSDRHAPKIFCRYYGFTWPLWFLFSLFALLPFIGPVEFLPERFGMDDMDIGLFLFYLATAAGGIWIGLLRGREKQFFGSEQHLRFGKVVAEAIQEAAVANPDLPQTQIHPAFAALFNETGGAVGVGGTGLFSTNTLLSVADGVLFWHGIVHDAGGFLCKRFSIPPGYEYRITGGQEGCVEQSWKGQITGILFWAEVLSRFDQFSGKMQIVDRDIDLPFLSKITRLDMSRLDSGLALPLEPEQAEIQPIDLLGLDRLEAQGLIQYWGDYRQGSIDFLNDELIVNLATVSAARREIICQLEDVVEPTEYRCYEAKYEEFETAYGDDHLAEDEARSRQYHCMAGVSFPSEHEISLASIGSREELAEACQRFFTDTDYHARVERSPYQGKIIFKEYIEKDDIDRALVLSEQYSIPLRRLQEDSSELDDSSSVFIDKPISEVCMTYLDLETSSDRKEIFGDFEDK